MTSRYAIYFAPAAGSAWWRFGSEWLGRDETTDRPLAQPPLPAPLVDRLAGLTAEPRRYGFHATLKAPFRLAEGCTEAGLLAQVGQLAATLRPLALDQLVPVYMDGFVALVPATRGASLQQLASGCVTRLDGLRAPLTAAERARRHPERLDDRGRELLDLHGYPHVMERFRFHMTLSGSVDIATAGDLVAWLAPRVERLNREEPPVLDRLCVFHEPAPGENFVRIADRELHP